MRGRSLFGTYQEVLLAHAAERMLGDRDRKGGPEAPAEQLLEIVLPGRRPRQHHGRVLALDLRVGVMHRVAIAVPGRLADIDEAHQPIGRLVERPRAKRRAVTAFMHRCEQAGEHDAVRQHRRQHEDRPVRQVDHAAACADGGEVADQIGETHPVAAPRQLLAVLLVDKLEWIKRHFLTLHRRSPGSVRFPVPDRLK